MEALALQQAYQRLETKFHPDTRQVLDAAKAYLKAMHGSTAALSFYIDSVRQLADGQHDTTLQKLEEQHKDQLKHLKTFYTNLITPIESYLTSAKPTLTIHLQQTTQKQAELTLNLKKSTSTWRTKTTNLNTKIKQLQSYQEAKDKYDYFMEMKLKEVQQMEVDRRGFVIGRVDELCSVNKVEVGAIEEQSVGVQTASSISNSSTTINEIDHDDDDGLIDASLGWQNEWKTSGTGSWLTPSGKIVHESVVDLPPLPEIDYEDEVTSVKAKKKPFQTLLRRTMSLLSTRKLDYDLDPVGQWDRVEGQRRVEYQWRDLWNPTGASR